MESCGQCGREFRSVQGLRGHEHYVHGGREDAESGKTLIDRLYDQVVGRRAHDADSTKTRLDRLHERLAGRQPQMREDPGPTRLDRALARLRGDQNSTKLEGLDLEQLDRALDAVSPQFKEKFRQLLVGMADADRRIEHLEKCCACGAGAR